MKSNNKVVEQVHKTRPELIMLIELDLSYISESASPLKNEKRTQGGGENFYWTEMIRVQALFITSSVWSRLLSANLFI